MLTARTVRSTCCRSSTRAGTKGCTFSLGVRRPSAVPVLSQGRRVRLASWQPVLATAGGSGTGGGGSTGSTGGSGGSGKGEPAPSGGVNWKLWGFLLVAAASVPMIRDYLERQRLEKEAASVVVKPVVFEEPEPEKKSEKKGDGKSWAKTILVLLAVVGITVYDRYYKGDSKKGEA